LSDAADLVNATGERKLALYELYWRIGKAPDAPHDDDHLRLGHARLLLARGRIEEARKLLSTVIEIHALARIRSDRLFDPLRADPAFEARLDLAAAAERDLAYSLAMMEEKPRTISAVNRHITKLLIVRRLDEALALADSTLAQDAVNPKAFSDGDESRRWLLDRRAAVLEALGRYAEATDSLLEAANQLEHRRSNVSNMINLASHLVRDGRPVEAMRLLEGIREPTRYGQAWIEANRSCGAVQIGNEAERQRSLEYLKAHEADNVSALSQALLCSNDVDGAAALMIRRLGSQRTSGDALLALQERPDTGLELQGFRKLLRDRFAALRAREDVLAAATAIGRIELLPVHLRGSF
jgi:tetratricopeptide (TPR) repeat protein